MAAEPAASTDDWSTASSIFTRLRPEVFVALFTRSLLATYCSPTGAAVLNPMAVSDDVELDPRATSMAGDSFRRLFRTVQFLDTMLTTPDPPSTAAVDGSPGRAKADLLRHIREGHDAAKADRAALAADDAVRRPELRRLANPINDVQLVGACSAFTVSVKETFDEHWPTTVAAGEWDAWARVWIDITLSQTTEPEAVVAYLDEAQPDATRPSPYRMQHLVAATNRIRWGTGNEPPHRARTLAGVRLAENLRVDLEDGIPQVLRRSIRVGMDVFGDPEVNRLLLVPSSVFTRPARLALRVAPALCDPLIRRYVRMVLEHMYSDVPQHRWDDVFSPGPTTSGPRLDVDL